MSDPVSALNHASFDGLARVEEIGLQGMITLRGDLSGKTITTAVTKAAGTTMPAPLQASHKGDRVLCWMSPDELLLMCPYGEVAATVARLDKALAKSFALAVDVSDARAVFRVSGPAAREVMAKLCPVDFSPTGLAPGAFRRTRMAQVAAAVWLVDDETVQIICFRSVATYVFNLLKTAAQPGSGVGVF